MVTGERRGLFVGLIVLFSLATFVAFTALPGILTTLLTRPGPTTPRQAFVPPPAPKVVPVAPPELPAQTVAPLKIPEMPGLVDLPPARKVQ